MSTELPPSVEGTEDRGRLLAGASGLFRLLAAVPGHRDDALAVVDGLFGDLLADAGSSLAMPMTIRAGGEALPLDREGLARAIAQPTGRLVVLVHGLMSTESVWRFRGAPDQTYGSLLAHDHGVTALTVRYNTGRHISTNGRAARPPAAPARARPGRCGSASSRSWATAWVAWSCGRRATTRR